MATRKRATSKGKAHSFGGDWTSTKLGVLEKYLRMEHKPTLFGTGEERVVKATNDSIGRYFNDRLKSIFPGVAEPGVLRNSSNCPLYLLCSGRARARLGSNGAGAVRASAWANCPDAVRTFFMPPDCPDAVGQSHDM